MSNFVHSDKVPRLYKEAAKILAELSRGGDFKSLIFNNKRVTNKKALQALVSKASQYRSIITRIFELTKLLQIESQLDECLARILIAELVFGKQKLGGSSKPVLAVEKYQQQILESLEKADRYRILENSEVKVLKPRYVRVNTLKISTDRIIEWFKKEGWALLECPSTYRDFLDLISKQMTVKRNALIFVRDFHVKDMLVFPCDVFLADHFAYNQGMIILQDKASCLLSCCVHPPPGSIILDMCAAPGMKTSLLAALINNQGHIYASDMSQSRCWQMQSLLEGFGVTCVTTINQDAGTLGPDTCQNVEYILVDPSCSGTGMFARSSLEDVETKMLKEQDGGAQVSAGRLQMLANLQGYLLRHALSSFPTAKCVIYSTCSLQHEENEHVIDAAISCATLNGFRLVDLPARIGDWRNLGSRDFESGSRCLYTRMDSDFTNGGFLAVFERPDDWRMEQTVKVEEEGEEDDDDDDVQEVRVELSEQFFVRINTLKISIDAAIQRFVDNGWSHLPSPRNYQIFISGFRSDEEKTRQRFFEQDFHIKELLIFPMGLKDSLTENLIKCNKFILQDKASCLSVHLLDPQPGSVVLNISCAGKENTTSFMASRMRNTGNIFAYEYSPCRYKSLVANLDAEGITCVSPVLDSGMNSSDANCPGVEYILVFPPSTGSGIRGGGKLSEKEKSRYTNRQFSILQHALSAFPSAKRIVYATKSIHPEENEEIVNALLIFAKFHGFLLVNSVERIEGWRNERKPMYHCGEKCLIAQRDTGITKGFFIAIFEKPNNFDLPKILHQKLEEVPKQEAQKMNCQLINAKPNIQRVLNSSKVENTLNKKGENVDKRKIIMKKENKKSNECSGNATLDGNNEVEKVDKINNIKKKLNKQIDKCSGNDDGVVERNKIKKKVKKKKDKSHENAMLEGEVEEELVNERNYIRKKEKNKSNKCSRNTSFEGNYEEIDKSKSFEKKVIKQSKGLDVRSETTKNNKMKDSKVKSKVKNAESKKKMEKRLSNIDESDDPSNAQIDNNNSNCSFDVPEETSFGINKVKKSKKKKKVRKDEVTDNKKEEFNSNSSMITLNNDDDKKIKKRKSLIVGKKKKNDKSVGEEDSSIVDDNFDISGVDKFGSDIRRNLDDLGEQKKDSEIKKLLKRKRKEIDDGFADQSDEVKVKKKKKKSGVVREVFDNEIVRKKEKKCKTIIDGFVSSNEQVTECSNSSVDDNSQKPKLVKSSDEKDKDNNDEIFSLQSIYNNLFSTGFCGLVDNKSKKGKNLKKSKHKVMDESSRNNLDDAPQVESWSNLKLGKKKIKHKVSSEIAVMDESLTVQMASERKKRRKIN